MEKLSFQQFEQVALAAERLLREHPEAERILANLRVRLVASVGPRARNTSWPAPLPRGRASTRRARGPAAVRGCLGKRVPLARG